MITILPEDRACTNLLVIRESGRPGFALVLEGEASAVGPFLGMLLKRKKGPRRGASVVELCPMCPVASGRRPLVMPMLPLRCPTRSIGMECELCTMANYGSSMAD